MVRTARLPLARTIASIIVTAGSAFAGVSAACAQGNATVSKSHIDAATAAAGTDLVGWLSLCRPARVPSQVHRPGMTSD